MDVLNKVQFSRLANAGNNPLPSYESEYAAGMDIRAALEEPVQLDPGKRSLIPTGFCMALPKGCEAQVRPRSGLAIKHGIGLLNSPGTIDADYRGEVKIIVINHGEESFTIEHGDRIAQLVISRIEQMETEEVDSLEETGRGGGGFGSTGK